MAEHVCPPWLSFTLTNAFRRRAQDPDRIVGPFVRTGDVVLDIGCGPGFFAVPMARMVGASGRVVAVDIHPGMLERTRRRAVRAGLGDRVKLHLAGRTAPGLDPAERADLALVFWMAHEVPDPGRLFAEIGAALKPGGRLLLVEPKLHVPAAAFAALVARAGSAGFVPEGEPRVRLSRAAVLGLRPAVSLDPSAANRDRT
ncbi:MAG: methyltransferase domain-containing protein [Candidatus Aminicenantes bacterium]|nr:methyltransferase domain-containing protein [Candidatus Aminicenantes bacterium]NLH77415.1 methyltransferase domain-containing protein [Acidobacteriota bacterium]